MDQDQYDDLLRRLTALVMKLDSTYDELLMFNREQVAINGRLERLIARVFPLDENGRTP